MFIIEVKLFLGSTNLNYNEYLKFRKKNSLIKAVVLKPELIINVVFVIKIF